MNSVVNRRIIYFIILGFIWALIIITIRPLNQSEVVRDMVKIGGERGVVGEITGEKQIIQPVTLKEGRIEGISLLTGTYARENTGTIVLILKDNSENVLVCQKVKTSSIADNTWSDIYFDNSIFLEGGEYSLIIGSEDSFPGNAVTLYYYQDNTEHGFISGDDQFQGTLCMRIHYYDSALIIRNGILWSILFIASIFLIASIKKMDVFALQEFVILLVFFIVVLSKHLGMRMINDDLTRFNEHYGWQAGSLLKYTFYLNGKVFTDGIAEIIIRYIPFSLWKVLDSLIWVILAKLLIFYLTDGKKGQAATICALLLLFPYSYLETAGFISVTTNYVYTFVSLLISILPLMLVVKANIKSKGWIWLLSFLGIIYTVNHDQYAIALISGSVILFFYFHYTIRNNFSDNKRVLLKKYTGILMVIAGLFYILEFHFPGHITRMSSSVEMLAYLPDYTNWTLIDKIYHGYTSTVAYLFFNRCGYIAVLMSLLALLSYLQGSKILKWTGLITFIMFIIINVLPRELMISFQNWPGVAEIDSLSRQKTISVLLLSFFFLMMILLQINLFIKTKMKHLLLLLLFLAAESRELMGFSATIYASSYRTFSLMSFIIIIINYYILQYCKQFVANH